MAGGPVTASGYIFCDYNHGIFRAWGGVKAQGLIIDDRSHDIAGPVEAVTLVLPGDDPRGVLVPELLIEDDDPSCDGAPVDDFSEVLIARIRAGLPVFREGVGPAHSR
jgi:hypothetical protein